jgi:hypothetical protein
MLNRSAACCTVLLCAMLAACGGNGSTPGTSGPSSSGGGVSATPTASPTPGALTVSPSPLQLGAIGEASPFTASEPFYSGAFSLSDTCSGIAMISPTSGSGPSQAFNVTALAVGTCAYTVHDTLGGSAVEQITVTSNGASQ